MAQTEFSMLSQACLRGRNADEDNLEEAVNDCVSERNTAEAAIGWRSPGGCPTQTPPPLLVPIVV